VFALCTPSRNEAGGHGARSALPQALRTGLAWRAAAGILGVAAGPSCKAADALLSAACASGGAAAVRGALLHAPSARPAAAACLPLWCFLQHAADNAPLAHFSLLNNAASVAAAAALASAAGHLSHGCQRREEEVAVLEAVGHCLCASPAVFATQTPKEVAAWLAASLDAAANASQRLLAHPAASIGAAGALLAQALPLVTQLLAHDNGRVAAAGLWALGALLRCAEPAQLRLGGALTAASAEELCEAAVRRLRSDDAAVRAAALGALPALLRLPGRDYNLEARDASGGGGPMAVDGAGGDAPEPDLSGAHPVVRLVARALAGLRAAAAAAGAPTQELLAGADVSGGAAAAASAALQSERVALLRGAAALGLGLAGGGCEAPLLVALADHAADDNPQVAAAAAELLQHRAALAGRQLQVRGAQWITGAGFVSRACLAGTGTKEASGRISRGVRLP
jgi:hypothetical protein